jgi:hypothetical protein
MILTRPIAEAQISTENRMRLRRGTHDCAYA